MRTTLREGRIQVLLVGLRCVEVFRILLSWIRGVVVVVIIISGVYGILYGRVRRASLARAAGCIRRIIPLLTVVLLLRLIRWISLRKVGAVKRVGPRWRLCAVHDQDPVCCLLVERWMSVAEVQRRVGSPMILDVLF